MNLRDEKNIPDIPYSINQVEKNINYFNSCCYYEYAAALRNYLESLKHYKSGRYQRPPSYPPVCQFQPRVSQTTPKSYKRPLMYQGINF